MPDDAKRTADGYRLDDLFSFSGEVAGIVGVNAAVVYHGIRLWCKHNEANGKNFHDGRYWTYNSMKAFSELFPFLSERQVRSALEKLIDAGLLVKGNYNKVAFDQTSWFALGDAPIGNNASDKNGKCGCQECQMTSDKNVRPIPSTYQVTTNEEPPIAPHGGKKAAGDEPGDGIPYERIVAYLNERSGKNFKDASQDTRAKIRARWREGFRLDDFRRVIDTKCAEWGRDPKMAEYVRPSTLFGTKFESYLNQGPVPGARSGGDWSAYD